MRGGPGAACAGSAGYHTAQATWPKPWPESKKRECRADAACQSLAPADRPTCSRADGAYCVFPPSGTSGYCAWAVDATTQACVCVAGDVDVCANGTSIATCNATGTGWTGC